MCWTFTPDGKKFTGSWGPQGTYHSNIRWIDKDEIPLLKDFEPISPLPNLLINSRTKQDTNQSLQQHPPKNLLTLNRISRNPSCLIAPVSPTTGAPRLDAIYNFVAIFEKQRSLSAWLMIAALGNICHPHQPRPAIMYPLVILWSFFSYHIDPLLTTSLGK